MNINFWHIVFVLFFVSLFIIYIISINQLKFFDVKECFDTSFQNICVFIISLESRKQTAQNTANLLKLNNINCNIVDAIVGKDINIEQLQQENVVRRDKGLNKSDKIAKNEVACTYSHKKTLNQIYNQEYKYCIIFEDDVVIPSEFFPKLRELLIEIEKINLNFDIIFLGASKTSTKRTHVLNNLSKIIDFKIGQCWGSYAYLVNKNSALKISRSFDFIDQPTDVLLFQRANEDLNIYICNEYIVHHGSLPSSIR